MQTIPRGYIERPCGCMVPDDYQGPCECELDPPDPIDDVDLEDCDLGDLLTMFEVGCYDGDAESGPCEPSFWVEPVERHDCDTCGEKDQRVVRRHTVWGIRPHGLYEGDPYAATDLACGHTIL